MVSDDEWNENIRKTIKERRPGTTDEELNLLNSSSIYWGSENYRSAANWIEGSIQLVDDPSCMSNSSAFINLYGLLDDIPKFLKEKSKVFSMLGITDDTAVKAFIATNTDNRMREHFGLLWESSQYAKTIASVISDDEIFTLGFLRHRYCHPTLSGYSVRIDGFLESSKFKVDKWKRLLEIGSKTKEDEFKIVMVEKIEPQKENLKKLATQLYQMCK